MSQHRNIPNPTGVGGLQHRPEDWFVIGVTAVCGARCRRTGLPCKMPPTRDGGGRCVHHGGGRNRAHSGRGKIALPKDLRQAHSKAMQLTRRAARAELAATTLHPDTMKVYARYQDTTYPADEAMLIMAIDQRLKGLISTSDLDVVRELAERYMRNPADPRPEKKQRRPAKRAASSPQPLVRPLGEVLREDLLERLKNAPRSRTGPP